MSFLKITTLTIVAIFFCLPQIVLATSHDDHGHKEMQDAKKAHHMESKASHGVRLSPELLALLNQEMGLIQQGVMDLVPAIAAGDWDKVATIGQKIKKSFILKQKLTDAQKKELHRVLPQQFI